MATVRAPNNIRVLLRHLLVRNGVAETARQFRVNRSQVLAIAVGLSVSTNVLACAQRSLEHILRRKAARKPAARIITSPYAGMPAYLLLRRVLRLETWN